ncbi:Serine/threonine-protein kinase [Polychaeton citri CBS 116435]|uniref:non-specific serine/threonine protein kinase n=1 Tax=Polychaeton citri CBS 116435 TaxID=1314669 RepID=A0A9P4Q2J0_9PEZI|nr:Serine/threonine-protein kinase [Polychaeton citri CBS 116435]
MAPKVSAIDFNEVQEDEVEALKAIYMEDYHEVETKGAWGNANKSFRLTLRALSDLNSYVDLSVTLTVSYPKSGPGLQVTHLEQYHVRTQQRIRNIVEQKPKALLGEVMIFSIASDIQDALEDAVKARQQGSLPSLEVERANANEVALELAKQAEANQARQQLEAQQEEDRVLKQMVEDEMNRREKRKSAKSPQLQKPSVTGRSETFVFEQPASMVIDTDTVKFTEVALYDMTTGSRNDRFGCGLPLLQNGHAARPVTVRQANIEKDRHSVMELEKVLREVKLLRHSAVIALLAYQLDPLGSMSRLTLCTESVERTLRDCIDDLHLSVNKSRNFTIMLLEGLEYVHRAGLVHGSLSVDTIIVTGQQAKQVKLAEVGYGRVLQAAFDAPSKWRPSSSSQASPGRKDDIWSLGLVIVQMLFGLEITRKYASPSSLMSNLELSTPLYDLLAKVFTTDTRKQQSAFDLLPSEFLRTDAPALDDTLGSPISARKASNPFRSRHNSSNAYEPSTSRYASDFTEIRRIGRGGFGEVVEARNKLDGGVFAIKKIRQAPQLDKILSEVMLLNRLNHPYVVRYYSTWVETDFYGNGSEDGNSITRTVTSTKDSPADERSSHSSSDESEPGFGFQSAGGYDFVSSSQADIQFGGSDSGSEAIDDEDSDDKKRLDDESDIFERDDDLNNDHDRQPGNVFRKLRSDSRRVPSILYIQMELCERRTLRDLVRQGLSDDDTWRFARQITEGLAHIHSHGVIHRDMKPDNVFIDVANHPKIGDFGLATTNHSQVIEASLSSKTAMSGDMTRSVGTALYVAPELRSDSNTSYTAKVDLYSLGIMFYEMCQRFNTAMERIRALQSIREKDFTLPEAYGVNGEKAAQGRLISCLISHRPSERPSSAELLRSDIIPIKIEDDTIRHFIESLSDQRSPYHQKLLSVLFSQDAAKRVKALAWDLENQRDPAPTNSATVKLVKRTLMEVFERHGAMPANRPAVFPRSVFTTSPNAFQLLDPYGNLLQLPFDLTFAHARQLSKQAYVNGTDRSYAFEAVFRDTFSGGEPRTLEEVDFDIVTSNPGFEASHDAEVLKVVDEIIDSLSSLASTNFCFHMNHGAILDAILDHCRVSSSQHAAVKEAISKLGFQQWNWARIRKELGSQSYGLPTTTLDDLEHFDFRETPTKAFQKLQSLLEPGGSSRNITLLSTAVQHLTRVLQIASRFGLSRKIYIAPLASFNAKYYEKRLIFQFLVDRKQHREVLAAGGRYDSLIKSLAGSHGNPRARTPLAVGVSIAFDRLVLEAVRGFNNKSKAFLKDSPRTRGEPELPKRADVLLIARNDEALNTQAERLLASMWSSGIAAEMVWDDFVYEESLYNLIVLLKHQASTTVRVRSSDPNIPEVDIQTSGLIAHIQQELREKDARSLKRRPPGLHRQSSQSQGESTHGDVQVLMAQHRSKKSNKYHIVEAARRAWLELEAADHEAPMLAVETRDDVIELLRYTRLGDPESWRKSIQTAQLNERHYLLQVQDILGDYRKAWERGDGTRTVGLFNFRTGLVVRYDVAL